LYKEKAALLQKYYHFTMKLITGMDGKTVEYIQQLLDERQNCIDEADKLDKASGQIVMNSVIRAQLLEISLLESELQEKLKKEQERIISKVKSLKKEKSIQQHYGESSIAPSGIFYDKRK